MGINATFFVELITFLVLIGLLSKVLYEPLAKALSDRAEKIAQGLAASDEAAKALDNAKAEANKIIDDAKNEAQTIINKAKIQADNLAGEITSKAKDEAANTIKAAQASIAQETLKVKKELKDEAVLLAILAATKVVGSDKSDQKQVVEKFLGELNEKSIRA